MAEIGRYNSLRVLRSTPQGLYLDGGDHGDILMPGRYVAQKTEEGSEVTVFVYRDSEDRLVATTETPTALVGEIACLKVKSIHPQVGAFLDWGLAKDLLLPFREQSGKVAVGQSIVVGICLDPKSDRIMATTRLNRLLKPTPHHLRRGQSVRLMMIGPCPLGWNALVNQTHLGLLYVDELPPDPEPGQTLRGYVRQVRPDGKLDLTLNADRGARVVSLTSRILDALAEGQGFLPFNDRTSPEAIRATFGVSKKVFKQTLGSLYKERKIRMVTEGIRRLDEAGD